MAYEDDEQQPSQKRLRKALLDQVRRAQVEQQKKELMKKILDQPAFDRLMNVRVSNMELYSQLVDLIISLSQQQRLQGKLTEAQLISILEKVTARKDTTIEFKHK